MRLRLSDIPKWLSRFECSTERGFLAGFPISDCLPVAFSAWEELVAALPNEIKQKSIRTKVERLPLLDAGLLLSQPQQERALLMLALLAHAYLHLPDAPVKRVLPKSIAFPWLQLAKRMNRPPVIHHASYALFNWEQQNEDRGFHPDNLRPRLSFLGNDDERGFITVTVAVEAAGAKALLAGLTAYAHLSDKQEDDALAELKRLNQHLQAMTSLLDSMPKYCSPEVFYHEIRPFLNGMDYVEFEGTGATLTFAGGSAAQSTLIQALDRLMGITHKTPYLQQMRAYMPAKHADMLDHLPIIDISAQSLPVQESLTHIKKELQRFRTAHLKLAAQYIVRFQPKDNNHKAVGTGGTELLPFLKEIRDESGK